MVNWSFLWPFSALSIRARRKKRIFYGPADRKGGGEGRGEGQNCKGQKCTEHELVLLMFFVLKRLDDLL